MRRALLVMAVMTAVAAGAGAQVMKPMPPGAPLPPEALAAAEQRAREVAALIDSGDEAAIEAYVAANWGRTPPPGAPGGPPPIPEIRRMQLDVGGLELQSVEPNRSKSGVTATYRSKMTGLMTGFDLEVTPDKPYRVPRVIPLRPRPPDLPEVRTDEEKAAYLDAMAGRMADREVFSGVVLIARDGTPLLSKAYGLADRGRKHPNTIDRRFNVGSMNKLFTALAIMQLVEQGKLSLEDPLSKFLPDFPDRERAQRVQIKHLLSHTSGLGTYFGPAFLARGARNFRHIADDLEVARGGSLAFEPGTR